MAVCCQSPNGRTDMVLGDRQQWITLTRNCCWCTKKVITHQFTTPYTSAKNSCVKHLHCKLMNKARAMCLSSNTFLHLWAEFVQTVSYLSMLTVSKPLGGQTLHKLWFGSCPFLSFHFAPAQNWVLQIHPCKQQQPQDCHLADGMCSYWLCTPCESVPMLGMGNLMNCRLPITLHLLSTLQTSCTHSTWMSVWT